jgi:tetratricopeptide (TPR) repeat protein
MEQEQLVNELQDLLETGKFDDARSKLRAAHISEEEIVARISDVGSKRIRAVAIISEILFAFGDDEKARSLLRPYVDEPSRVLASALEPRQKLQIAEYHYSRFDLEQAEEVATRILRDAARASKPLDVGECHYYLARFALRRTHYLDASKHCIRALEVVHRSTHSTSSSQNVSPPGRGSKSLLLQTGRLLRVRGTALWWLGRLDEATAVLYLSAWMLKESEASTIYTGDALHALGRLLRSLGPSRYAEARAVLEQACEHYREHDLKQARVLNDLARTLANYGLHKLEEHEEADARLFFEDSFRRLQQSLKISNGYCAGDDPPILWIREKLDALVWTSWLHQEGGPLVDLNAAYSEAKEAVELAERTQGRPEHVEALLALGHAALLLHRFPEAEEHLKRALEVAKKLEVTKLIVHAYLRLAQLACRASRDLKKAEEYFSQADKLRDDPNADGYLNRQAAKVGDEIKDLARSFDRFVLTLSDLIDSRVPAGQEWNRLKVLRARTEKWVIDAAIQHHGGVAQAAKFLGISQGSIREIRWRYQTARDAASTTD